METNLKKYKADLESLVTRGELLLWALQYQCFPEVIEKRYQKDTIEKIKQKAPSFRDGYQSWYSEAKAVVSQLLPDRFQDFVSYYERPRARKQISAANYVIEDCLQGLEVTKSLTKEKVVGEESAIPIFQQQLNIFKSVERRFESSLFDIKQLVQADVFDSELDTARELLKNGFVRAAGAVAGVVLEKHLDQVCGNHKIKVANKNPGISVLNDLLKAGNVVDVPVWRFIQHLGDLRNLCDHSKEKEPTRDEVSDLIGGVDKTTKTLF